VIRSVHRSILNYQWLRWQKFSAAKTECHAAAVTLETARIVAGHRRFNRIRQVAPLCTPVQYVVHVGSMRAMSPVKLNLVRFGHFVGLTIASTNHRHTAILWQGPASSARAADAGQNGVLLLTATVVKLLWQPQNCPRNAAIRVQWPCVPAFVINDCVVQSVCTNFF